MNEVLQDGSNKSPLLSGEESAKPPFPAADSFHFEDNLEDFDDVNPLPQPDLSTQKSESQYSKRVNSGEGFFDKR